MGGGKEDPGEKEGRGTPVPSPIPTETTTSRERGVTTSTPSPSSDGTSSMMGKGSKPTYVPSPSVVSGSTTLAMGRGAPATPNPGTSLPVVTYPIGKGKESIPVHVDEIDDDILPEERKPPSRVETAPTPQGGARDPNAFVGATGLNIWDKETVESYTGLVQHEIWENKSLSAFLKRFNQAALEAPTTSLEVKINVLNNGVMDGDLFSSLTKKLVANFDDLLKRAEKYITLEEVQKAKSKPSASEKNKAIEVKPVDPKPVGEIFRRKLIQAGHLKEFIYHDRQSPRGQKMKELEKKQDEKGKAPLVHTED
ncbi:hypothetical protein ACS0TY_013261 [Phlomoides rotata]